MSIDWHTIIANALTQVGIAGLAISAVAWLAKKIGSNRLADDAEKFKIEIQARANQRLSIRAGRIHERQLDILQSLYRHLYEAQGYFERLTTMEGWRMRWAMTNMLA